jgi:hypothetical protein
MLGGSNTVGELAVSPLEAAKSVKEVKAPIVTSIPAGLAPQVIIPF